MHPEASRRPVTAREFIRYLLAGIQILAGAHPLLYDWKLLVQPSATAVITVLLELLLISAGVALLVAPRPGRILTIVAQGVQCLGLVTPGFAWVVHFGVATGIQLEGVHSNIPGESWGRVGASIEYASTVDVVFGGPHPDYEGYMLSINLVAVAMLITAVLLFRGRRE